MWPFKKNRTLIPKFKVIYADVEVDIPSQEITLFFNDGTQKNIIIHGGVEKYNSKRVSLLTGEEVYWDYPSDLCRMVNNKDHVFINPKLDIKEGKLTFIDESDNIHEVIISSLKEIVFHPITYGIKKETLYISRLEKINESS